jgi:hypothetical protein
MPRKSIIVISRSTFAIPTQIQFGWLRHEREPTGQNTRHALEQDLWQKLINSETTASFFSHGMKDNSYSNLQLLGIMIFDIKTEHFVGNQGYISVDTPPRGRVARFGPYIARYIGWG